MVTYYIKAVQPSVDSERIIRKVPSLDEGRRLAVSLMKRNYSGYGKGFTIHGAGRVRGTVHYVWTKHTGKRDRMIAYTPMNTDSDYSIMFDGSLGARF